MGQFSACAWLRGIAGQKKAPVHVLLEEALFALLLLDSAQPAHPAWRRFYLAAVGGEWYITGNYHQTPQQRKGNQIILNNKKRKLVVSIAAPDVQCDCSPLRSSIRAVCESVMTDHSGRPTARHHLHGRWGHRRGGPAQPRAESRSAVESAAGSVPEPGRLAYRRASQQNFAQLLRVSRLRRHLPDSRRPEPGVRRVFQRQACTWYVCGV